MRESEDAFASYCFVGHCVGTATSAAAIAVALKTLGAGLGGEVITTANSFIATSEAVPTDGVRAVHRLSVVPVPPRSRAGSRAALKPVGVDTGIDYPVALPYLNARRHLGLADRDFRAALRASGEVLSLPMFAELTAEQARDVAERVCWVGAQPRFLLSVRQRHVIP